MSLALSGPLSGVGSRPARYRSLQTLLALMVASSLGCSMWLLPNRLERITAASERGDAAMVERELARATVKPSGPGEMQGLVDVALALGKPGVAAGILERAIAQEPDNLAAIRLLLEIQRQRHRMRDVAALDERLFALTGAADALRDAADIYASERLPSERLGALRRLQQAGRATASDMAELATRMFQAGAGADALPMLMSWMAAPGAPRSSELVALAAGLSTRDPAAAEIAARLGVLIGESDDEGLLHVVIQAYAERSRPDLSLIAARSLSEPLRDRAAVALVLAQLEMAQNDFASARARLQALAQQGRLAPAAQATLAELDLEVGDLPGAVAQIAGLPPGLLADRIARRVVDAATLVHRSDLLAPLSPETFAAVSPGSAAVVALAQGSREQAEAYARSALTAGGATADLGAAFAGVVHALGLERLAVSRLLEAARAGALDDGAVSLLLEVADAAPVARAQVLEALRSQRDSNAAAGAAWAVAATRGRGGAEVADWLRQRGPGLSSDALVSVLTAADDVSDATVARSAATVLSGRTDLPNDWSAAELAFVADTIGRRPTADALRSGLGLLVLPTTAAAARDRIVARLNGLAGARQLLLGLTQTPQAQDAAAWLAGAVGPSTQPDSREARLTLLSILSPARAAVALASVWRTKPDRFLPMYVAALINDGRARDAATALDAGLGDIAPARREAVLFDAMARVSGRDTIPILRIGATLGKPDWVTAYHDALARAGMLGELRADLSARAAQPGSSAADRRAIAASLLDLGDRLGAIAIWKQLAADKPPTDPDVVQLVYLWGPRASPDAVAWLRDRAASAPAATFPKWLEHLAYIGANDAVVDLGERAGGRLGTSATALQAFQAALGASHRSSKLDLRTVLAAAKGPENLSAVTQAALNDGNLPVAWLAASTALAEAPADPVVLRQAAQVAGAVHRSADSAQLYERLLSLGPQPVDVSVDAGDALLTARQASAARRVLRDALARQPVEPRSIAEARLRARTLLLLGRQTDTLALLRSWLSQFPAHAGLKADLLQAQLQATGGASDR